MGLSCHIEGIYVSESIEDKITRNDTKIEYKGCVIWLQSYALKSGGWVPNALVIVPEAEGNGQQELRYPGGGILVLREAADVQVFAMAKQWVDERLAGHRQLASLRHKPAIHDELGSGHIG
jgi:hypothetical protein